MTSTQALHDLYATAPITHPDACTRYLRAMYATAIAVELESLAAAPDITAELLLRRAAYLRDGARRENLTEEAR